MCILTETIYTGCACTIPEIECCPRCPDKGYRECKDFKKELEMQKGVCVGLGACPFSVGENSDDGGKGEEISVTAWDEKKWLGWF